MAPGHGPDLVQAVGVKGREGQLARAVHTDARHRCVQPSADTVVAGAVDGTQQRLEPRVFLAVFDSFDSHGHAIPISVPFACSAFAVTMAKLATAPAPWPSSQGPSGTPWMRPVRCSPARASL